jgi:hypothetical protein
MDQTLRVDLIMIIGTMPRRTLRIVNQKPTQQAEKLKTMPLSSNRAESKTTLSNLGLEKESTNSLNTFSTRTQKSVSTKAKIPAVQNSPNNLVHNGTGVASRQGKAAHKGGTSKLSRRHHLDSKVAQTNQQEGTRTPTATKKPFTAGWERLLQVSGRPKQSWLKG